MSFSFRTIGPFDNEGGLKFAKTIYGNFAYLRYIPEMKHTSMEILRLVTDKNFIGIMVYSPSDALVGYLVGEKMALQDGRYVFYVSYLYVSDKYRDRGLGSKLIDIIITLCREELGIHFIVLTCLRQNTKACNFYLHKGFKDDILIHADGDRRIMTYYIDTIYN